MPIYNGEEPPTPPTIPPSSPPLNGDGELASGGTGAEPIAANGSKTFNSASSSTTSNYTFTGSYSNNTDHLSVTRKFRVYRDGVLVYNPGFGGGTQTSSSFSSSTPDSGGVNLYADDAQYAWRALVNTSEYGNNKAALLYFKSGAVTATASAPSASLITSTTARLIGYFYPNTLHSVATVWLEYKKTSDSTWTQAGTSIDVTGYSELGIQRDITGLTPATQYDMRISMTRTTVNATSLTGTSASFTTLAGEPETTTNAAAGISHNSATLSQTVDVNEGTSILYYWKWGTDNPPTQNTTATNSISADGTVTLEITGLTASTTYYAQAYISFATPTGSPNNGSVVSFATVGNPSAEALNEELVDIFTYYGKYGVATTLTFTLRKPAATSSDLVYVSTAPVQADCLVFKDGVYDNTSDNAPTQVSTYLYTLQLSAAEMQADIVDVVIHDADATAFRDCHLRVITALNLGNVSIDADARTDNKPGLYSRGDGSGAGAQFVGGATGNDITGILGDMVLRESTCPSDSAAGTIVLDASASASDDYYNGALVLVYSGTGAGQARVITDYTGSSKTANVNKNWTTTPLTNSKFIIFPGNDLWKVASAAQLSSLPTVTSNYADMLQFVFQRFALKRTQTATEFKTFKSDGTTALGTGSVTDDGTTQTHGALS